MKPLSQTRIKAIIRKWKKGHDMFNWCEEYKDWVSSGVHRCVTMEWEYILKKGYEDREAPFSYDDVDLFDVDNAREMIEYKFDEYKDEFKAYANNPDTFNRRVKTKGDFRVFLNSLDKDDLQIMISEFSNSPYYLDDHDCDREIYEWWIVTDPVMYELEQQGEVILEGAWGRCTTGQGFNMDGVMQHAFIDRIKRWLK